MAKSMRLGGNWGMDDYTIMVAWARHPKQLGLLAAAVEIACTDLFFFFVSLIIGISGGRVGYEYLL